MVSWNLFRADVMGTCLEKYHNLIATSLEWLLGKVGISPVMTHIAIENDNL